MNPSTGALVSSRMNVQTTSKRFTSLFKRLVTTALSHSVVEELDFTSSLITCRRLHQIRQNRHNKMDNWHHQTNIWFTCFGEAFEIVCQRRARRVGGRWMGALYWRRPFPFGFLWGFFDACDIRVQSEVIFNPCSVIFHGDGDNLVVLVGWRLCPGALCREVYWLQDIFGIAILLAPEGYFLPWEDIFLVVSCLRR